MLPRRRTDQLHPTFHRKKWYVVANRFASLLLLIKTFIQLSHSLTGGKLSSLRAVAVPSAECKPIALKLPKFTIVNEHDTGSPNQHRDSISTNETMSTTSSCTGSPHATPEKSKSPRKLSGNNTTHEKIKPRELSANNKSPETSIALRKRGVACGNVACEKMYDKWSEDSTRSSTQGHKMHTL